MIRRGAWVFVVVLGAGCGPAHIANYTPKQRPAPTLATAPDAPPADASPGSLYAGGATGTALFLDARAYRVNDIVVVRVQESADAERSAETNTHRRNEAKAGWRGVPLLGPIVESVLGVIAPGTVLPLVDAELEGWGESGFQGEGATGRSERLVATVSTIVKAVMPNGNLFVEGHRVILVNQEEHHLYVSGIVRPIDIDENNAIDSSRIAEAHIEFVGQGVVTDGESPGWLARATGSWWPF